VPLTDYQATLAQLLSENRTHDSYLAGGAAMLIEANTTRFSRHLNYFHDSETRVAEAFSADLRLLKSRGYSIEVDLNQPGFIRAIVLKGKDATKVEWAHDSAWRFTPLSLLDLLRRRGRVRGEDLERLHLASPIALQALKKEWLDALESVEAFVASRPPEVGCLYFSSTLRTFVDPRDSADAVPHFGRPGGLLPRITDSFEV